MNKFLQWKEMSDSLSAIKADEAALRRELCAELLGDKQGNFKETLEEQGLRVVATSKTSTSLDERVLQQLMGGLSDAEKSCVKYKPSLIAAMYKVLPEGSILHEAVTVKPAMPTLSVEVMA